MERRHHDLQWSPHAGNVEEELLCGEVEQEAVAVPKRVSQVPLYKVDLTARRRERQDCRCGRTSELVPVVRQCVRAAEGGRRTVDASCSATTRLGGYFATKSLE